jgi:hypothetical protein
MPSGKTGRSRSYQHPSAGRESKTGFLKFAKGTYVSLPICPVFYFLSPFIFFPPKHGVMV